ncbi:MAG: hypothetical protein GC145_05230 [Caulobacter sp.]|nr:hypothetical protein [Caulobacter sp.]
MLLGILKLVRRMIEGSVMAILLIGIVAVFGVSETINRLLSDHGVSSLVFLLVLAIVLADLIGKFIGVVSATFPDIIPKLDDDHLERASLIERLRPGQTLALLSGAYAARLAMFLIIFALLGASYAWAPVAVQETLVGPLGPLKAIELFLREGVAGSVGYFLFFLGPENLKPITGAITPEPLAAASLNGDIFLVGIRVYGLAFVLAVLRTLVTPITLVRARGRAGRLTPPAGPSPEPVGGPALA